MKQVEDGLEAKHDIPFEELQSQIMEILDRVPTELQTHSRLNESLLVDLIGQCIKMHGLDALTI